MQRAARIAAHLTESTPELPSMRSTPTHGAIEARQKYTKRPLRVVVTGAAGQIGYALLPMIADGRAFGDDQPLVLHLLEVPPAEKALQGVVMELTDAAYPLLTSIVATVDPSVGFKNVDYAVLVGAFPRKQGMERKDLLEKNASIFKSQGEALEAHAARHVLVVGNPANTNALICAHYAPSIPREHFTALTRLDQHRAAAQVAAKLGVPVSAIRNVVIWGNHSATQVPDLSHATVETSEGPKPVAKLVDSTWVPVFAETVQKRGAAVIAARGASSALSAARAIVEHLRSWHCGTAQGEWVSMGVVSVDGQYGAPKNVVFSYPVTIRNGKWQVVKNLPISEHTRIKIKATGDELIEERRLALGQ